MIELVLPGMIKRNKGLVVNISSMTVGFNKTISDTNIFIRLADKKN